MVQLGDQTKMRVVMLTMAESRLLVGAAPHVTRSIAGPQGRDVVDGAPKGRCKQLLILSHFILFAFRTSLGKHLALGKYLACNPADLLH